MEDMHFVFPRDLQIDINLFHEVLNDQQLWKDEGLAYLDAQKQSVFGREPSTEKLKTFEWFMRHLRAWEDLLVTPMPYEVLRPLRDEMKTQVRRMLEESTTAYSQLDSELKDQPARHSARMLLLMEEADNREQRLITLTEKQLTVISRQDKRDSQILVLQVCVLVIGALTLIATCLAVGVAMGWLPVN
jgi:arsenate reductase-like glutaredoxin family protein